MLSNRTLIAITAAAWAFQLLYLVMPIDLIPDLIPVLGLLDDFVGLSGTLGLTWFTGRQLHASGAFDRLLRDNEPVAYEPIDELELRHL